MISFGTDSRMRWSISLIIGNESAVLWSSVPLASATFLSLAGWGRLASFSTRAVVMEAPFRDAGRRSKSYFHAPA